MLFLNNVSGASDECSQPRFCGLPIAVGMNTTAGPSSSASGQGSELQSAASSLFTDGSTAASGLLASSPPYSTNATSFSGWVQLVTDISTIRSASSLCQYFGALLLASSGTSTINGTTRSSNISGFVLYEGGGQFALLAAPRASAAFSLNYSAIWAGSVALDDLSTVLGEDDPRMVFLVNRSSFTPTSVNTSFACVMDWISTDSGVWLAKWPACLSTGGQ